ncbi:TPA: ATP-binding cassette domain-containing protein, partial [Streptococcus pneumoniae]
KHAHSLKESLVAAIRRKPSSTSFNAVDHLTVTVPEGQTVAVLGRNGSGKSTTLKLLSGVMRPDEGWIRTRGRVAGLLEVGAGFHPDLTGRENVYLNAAILGMTKEETDARFNDILEFSEIGEFIDTEVKHYSSGMFARLGFSVAVHTEVDILLVDEVLSVGDAAFREKCNERMIELQKQGKTIFVVSHNAEQVQRLCTRGIVLEKGRLIFDGPIDDAIEYVRPIHKTVVDGPPEGHPVAPELSKLYDERPFSYGRAVAPAQTITENGGGVWQEFETGAITYSAELKKVVGINTGSFLNAYLSTGGASGPWGFLLDGPHGTVMGGDRRYTFQNGVAYFAEDRGVWFE